MHKPDLSEGRRIPLTLWKCLGCGKRARGDKRIWPHLKRSGHGAAISVVPQWKSSHQ